MLVPAKKAEAMVKAAGRPGLQMGGVAPLLTLDSLGDPLLLAGSKGLDFGKRPHLSDKSAEDPLGLKTKRQPLVATESRHKP